MSEAFSQSKKSLKPALFEHKEDNYYQGRRCSRHGTYRLNYPQQHEALDSMHNAVTDMRLLPAGIPKGLLMCFTRSTFSLIRENNPTDQETNWPLPPPLYPCSLLPYLTRKYRKIMKSANGGERRQIVADSRKLLRVAAHSGPPNPPQIVYPPLFPPPPIPMHPST